MKKEFITVSIKILQDKNLSANQKFIFAEIVNLNSLDKGCIASNQHFSEMIGITTQGVSKAINKLEKDGYVKIDNAQTKRNFGRVITINSGKSAINSGKSPINSGLESKENITNNITKNTDKRDNKADRNEEKKTDTKLSDYEIFLNSIREIAPIKSRVTKTKEGAKLFKQLKDPQAVADAYILHQAEKGKFASRITVFMEDAEYHLSNAKAQATKQEEEIWM